MPKAILTCLCLVLFCPRIQARQNALTRFQKLRKEAVEAQRRGEFRPALENYLKLLDMVPHKPDINYQVAGIQAVLGDSRKAMEYLKRALSLGYPLDKGLDESFNILKESPGYQEIQTMIEALKTPVGNSRIALSLSERDLLPEGIAYDSGGDCFYLGSLWKSKIIKIDRGGKAQDFVKEKQDGLWAVAGLKVDPGRRILWAVSFRALPWARPAPGETGWSAVFKYDLKTGKIIKRYEFDDGEVGHLLNDLTVTSSGDVFVTDSIQNEIYAIFHDADVLESFVRSDEFMFTNGITMGNDDRTLFMASPGNGVYRIDIPSRGTRLVTHPEGMTLSGIDGLYFYDDSLIGVQPSLHRIGRFYLNSKGDSVERLEIVEARNPLFDFPTTGTIAGKAFYYIANSQAYSFNPDGTLFPFEKLKDVVILCANLKK
jgi:tetratricopeptide (TPR) repeat protein